MTKIIVAFRNFANAPKNCTFCPHSDFVYSVWVTQQTAVIWLYSINWLVFKPRRSVFTARYGLGIYIQFYVLPTHCVMCFVWIWEQTAIISLYSINWLVFITETESVYCAVRTGSIYNSTFCPHTVFMCFVWISEQTAIIPLYNINWLVFITEMESVYCAVRTGYLNKLGCVSSLNSET